jgi:hypothetical protein
VFGKTLNQRDCRARRAFGQPPVERQFGAVARFDARNRSGWRIVDSRRGSLTCM